jgi:hypothetical protein
MTDSCHFLPVDDDYVFRDDNKSVSVMTSDHRVASYTQFTFVEGKLFVCVTSPPPPPATEINWNGELAATIFKTEPNGSLIAMFRLDRVQSLTSMIGLLVSIVSLSVCLVAYVVLFVAVRRGCRSPSTIRRAAVLCLVACLLAAELVHLLGPLFGHGVFPVNGSGTNHVGASVASNRLCHWLAVTSHYMLLAAFFWLNVLAMDAVRNSSAAGSAESDVSKSSSSSCSCCRFVAYSIYAWVVPAAIVAGSVVADLFALDEPLLRPHYARSTACWLAGRSGILLLYGLPLAALTVADLILFTVAGCRRLSSSSNGYRAGGGGGGGGRDDRLYSRREIASGAVVAVLLALTWTSALLAAYLQQSFLWYVFVGLDTAVALFVCLAFAATSQVFDAIRQCCRKRSSVDGGGAYDEMDSPASGKFGSGRGPAAAAHGGRFGVNGHAASYGSTSRSAVGGPEYDEVISQETSI